MNKTYKKIIENMGLEIISKKVLENKTSNTSDFIKEIIEYTVDGLLFKNSPYFTNFKIKTLYKDFGPSIDGTFTIICFERRAKDRC